MAPVTVSESAQPSLKTRPAATDVQQRKNRPVLYWAALGVACLLLEIYVFTRWIMSGPTRTPDGPTDSGQFQTWAIAIQALAVAAFVIAVWVLLLRPLKRDGKMTLDGMLVLVFILIYWQDPMGNYQSNTFTYNTNYLNFGSWGNFIPGWTSPNGDKFPEAILFYGTIYVWGVLGGMMFGCMVMRKARERWPQLSGVGVAGIGLAMFFVFDMVVEPLFMAVGVWSYPGLPGPALFAGTYYQLPLCETLVWGICWFSMTAVRFYRNDKGETIAERGIDDVRVGSKTKTAIRVMALSGIMNLLFFTFYNLPLSFFFGSQQDPWVSDVTSRSNFTAGVCGPGTTFACPGGDMPILKGESGYRITPEGKLVTPDEARQLTK